MFEFTTTSRTEQEILRLTRLSESSLAIGKPVFVHDSGGEYKALLDAGSIPYSSVNQDDLDQVRPNFENMSPGIKLILASAAGSFFREFTQDLTCKPHISRQ
jgi:hypothetical protein